MRRNPVRGSSSRCHASAPTPNGAEAAPPDTLHPVIVTGTRVVRDGFQAPPTTTVLGADALEIAATTTVADTINRLPSFSHSSSSHNSNNTASTGRVGVNYLNLRGIGSERTLVLLDGQRAAGSDSAGLVDINVVPTGLIKRIDVVTGVPPAWRSMYPGLPHPGEIPFVFSTARP